MDRDLMSWRPYRWALAALALSIAVALWTLVQAIRLDDVPEATAPAFASAGELAMPPAAPPANVSAAVEKDLFSPDRTAPGERYHVPGESDPNAVAAVEATPPTVLGTAVSAGGRSFATCQLGDGPTVIVRVGDRIGEYTVKTIERGRVVFATANGKQLDIPALKPGS